MAKISLLKREQKECLKGDVGDEVGVFFKTGLLGLQPARQ